MLTDKRQPAGQGGDNAKTGVAAVGVAAFAVLCCAGAPLLVAVASSVALGTVLGVATGVVALVALTALVVVRT